MTKIELYRQRVESIKTRMEKAHALPPPPPAIHASAPSAHIEADRDPVGLEAIREVESSGGKNLNHPVITDEKSMHFGHQAGSSYAVMPKTFKDLVGNHPHLKAKYGHIASKPHEEITRDLNTHPTAGRDAARAMHADLSRKFPHDHARVAHAWLHGPGNTVKRTDAEVHEHPYVQKYLKAHANIHAKRIATATASMSAQEEPTPPQDYKPMIAKALDEGSYGVEDGLEKADHAGLMTEDMTPHYGKKCFVYYNLHRKVFSVRHKGKVIAHTKEVHISNPEFKVSEKGRQKVLATQTKNVHAGVFGVVSEPKKLPEHATRVSYNPYSSGTFVEADKPGKPAIHEAEHAHLVVHETVDPNGHSVRIPRVHAVTSFEPRLKKRNIEAQYALQKAIASIPVGKKVHSDENKDLYSYDHVLSDEHRKAGYSIRVHENKKYDPNNPDTDNKLKAVLYHQAKPVGRVVSDVHGSWEADGPSRKHLTPHSGIAEPHQGRGLGTALYESLYSHAKNKLNIHSVQGGPHTDAAGRVHESLARKHGLRYKPDEWEGLDRGDYRYMIKDSDHSSDLLKAEPNKSGVMVAFYVPDSIASKLAIPNGEAPKELHLTLAFCGPDSAEHYEKACEVVSTWSRRQSPVSATISGIGRFNVAQTTDANPVYASVSSPGIQRLHISLVEALKESGVPVSEKFGYTPHVTLAYVSEMDDLPLQRLPPMEWALDRVSVVGNNERRKDFVLGSAG